VASRSASIKAKSPTGRRSRTSSETLPTTPESIAEIQQGLRKAERKIEADARARIRAPRQDARAQLAALKSRRRDVTQTLKRLAGAAGGSWEDIKQSADAGLAEARTTAASVIERFRNALGA
jgi:uncharacterized coiled-coil DUF342 family protein